MPIENKDVLTEFGIFDPELAKLALKIDQVNVALCRRPEFQVSRNSYSLSEKLMDGISWFLHAKVSRWEVSSNDIWFGITESKPQSIKGKLRTTKTAFGGRFLAIETLLNVDGEEVTRRRLSGLRVYEGKLGYLPTPRQLMEFEVRIHNLVH